MPRKKPADPSFQTCMRIPRLWAKRADALCGIGPLGVTYTRTDIFRMALARGLNLLESTLAPSAGEKR